LPWCLYVSRVTGAGRDEVVDGEIRLWPEDDWWIAKYVETGVTTHGESRESALSNLDEAVALYRGEIGHEPTEEELRELGIHPENNTTGDRALPDWLE
jgi:predicted RNase H-like HicB family nuclease